LRVTLIGCGGIARAYRDVYRTHPGVQLVAACDVNPEEAAAAARGHNGALITQDLQEALRTPADLCVISTPNDLHAQHTVAALESGSAVLVQKPIARTFIESETVLEAQEKFGLPVGVYMSSLDNPVHHDMRKAVAEGWFGTVVKLKLVLAHRGGLSWGSDSWRSSSTRTGGGSWLMLAPHLIHLAQWITGQSVTTITGAQGRLALAHIEGDDITSAVAALDGGTLVEVTTGWSHDDVSVEVFGTEGSFRYRSDTEVILHGERDFHGSAVRHRGGDTPSILSFPSPPMGALDNPLEQHAEAIKAMTQGKQFACTAAEAARDMRILDAVATSKGVNIDG